MDQKRLVLAVALSLAIWLGFQLLVAPHLPKPPAPQNAPVAALTQPGTATTGGTAAATPAEAPAASAVPANAPRLPIDAKRLHGSISLLGARLDDIVLNDYRETIDPGSPQVRLLEPRSDSQPYYVQYGWTAPAGTTVKVPTDDTVWTASAPSLTTGGTVTLSWDNGEGLTFLITLAVDDDYMFSVRQSVKNATGQPVALLPWSRVRRDYTPTTLGYSVLHEGMLGVLDGTLKEETYSGAKSDGEKKGGIAFRTESTGGWAGFTDKYWLTAIIPSQNAGVNASFRHIAFKGQPNPDRYQVDLITKEAITAAPGGQSDFDGHLFVGAKVSRILDRYETDLNVPHLDKAVDFGRLYLITRPMYIALNFIYGLVGNFGVAIMIFTVIVKALFFPLADYSYRSMSKMKLLAPKMQELKERYKDDPAKMQQETMALYKAEKVNPASGCLPILVQIPVFFSLYKCILINIDMRQAPFFGWIHDLSQVDPTNVFNLFGLIPFDPGVLSPYLHLGFWPLVMGVTMFLQQKLNPPPPDPVQAKMFQFMPIMFTFMMAGFPAGLIIYWTWNNTLSMGQQWLMMRRTRLSRPSLART
jgi:YidC/Oxa1 family membrane protein insertase